MVFSCRAGEFQKCGRWGRIACFGRMVLLYCKWEKAIEKEMCMELP